MQDMIRRRLDAYLTDILAGARYAYTVDHVTAPRWLYIDNCKSGLYIETFPTRGSFYIPFNYKGLLVEIRYDN